MPRAVIFSGAGLSAESGIPTFRDSMGLWEQHRVEDVASPAGWRRDPELVLSFYAQRFRHMLTCRPNAAHAAIARLQTGYDVINITQNIDNLLEQAGATNVWHLHGRIDEAKCERHWSTAMVPHKKRACHYLVPITEPLTTDDRCPDCGGRLRPNVVWFGEAVDMCTDDLEALRATTDVFIGVGTSAQVYPAAGLLTFFGQTPQRFFIDPHPDLASLCGYQVLTGTAATLLPELVAQLLTDPCAPRG